jgi:hypothetical protein
LKDGNIRRIGGSNIILIKSNTKAKLISVM